MDARRDYIASDRVNQAGTVDRRSLLLRCARLGVPILIALLALLSLRRGFLTTGEAATGARVEYLTQMQDDEPPGPNVTKVVEPANPDTGSVVTITFVITGVGPHSLDVALVQDVSGSMAETVTSSGSLTRLQASKDAALDFVGELRSEDWAALVAYSDSARLVQPLTADRDVISQRIGDLESGGSTNISAGGLSSIFS